MTKANCHHQWPISFRIFWLMITSLVIVGCGSSGDENPPPPPPPPVVGALQSIKVEINGNSPSTVEVNQSTHFLAKATYTDGQTRILTEIDNVLWNSTNGNLKLESFQNGSAHFTGLRPGKDTVQVTVDGVTSSPSEEITIVESRPELSKIAVVVDPPHTQAYTIANDNLFVSERQIQISLTGSGSTAPTVQCQALGDFSQGALTIDDGKSLNITKEVQWSVLTNGGAGEIDSNGLFKALKEGSVQVVAQRGDKRGTLSVVIHP